MQEITVEMILETVRKELNELEEKYRQSKSPKKEWEIVAYRVRDKNVYYLEYTDDIGRIWGNAEWKGAFIDSADVNHPDVNIFSVRRLSDGEVFSVGDRIKTETYPNCVIESFSINNNTLAIQHTKNTLFVTWGNVDYFNKISKLPQPILTTVDGVDLYEGMEFWVVTREKTMVLSPSQTARESDRGHWQMANLFSTKEAADAFVVGNATLLSLSDVKEAMQGNWMDAQIVESLTALVKQKLNQ